MNQRISYLENENKNLIMNIKKSHYKTMREKIRNKYLGFIAIEIVMICFITFFFLFNPFIIEKYRLVSLIYWDLFFLLEVAIDGYLLYQIQKLDIYTSTLKEVAARAASNWRLHKIAILIGMPLAFGAIFLLILAIDANEYTIYGMIVGGLVGLLIGFRQLSKFRNYYKLLQVQD